MFDQSCLKNMTDSGKIYTESYVKIEGIPRDDGLYTIPDCIKHYAGSLGDAEAIVFADYDGGRQAVTFSQIYEKSTAVARSFLRLGVQKGELVAINMRTCPEWLYFVFGAMFAGAVPVSISFTYKDGSDLIAIMEKLQTCCLLALDPGIDGWNWKIVKNLVDEYTPDGKVSSVKLSSLRYLVGHEVGDAKEMHGVKTIDEFLRGTNSTIILPDLEENDLAFLVQTSGSTGAPKLVAHTHMSALISRKLGKASILFSSEILYNDRPFSWIGGFPLSLTVGQKRVTVSGFCHTPKDRIAYVFEIVQRERCTLVTALPPMLHALVRAKNEVPADWPVKAVLTGGQPLTKNVTDVIGKVSECIAVGYGGTEFGIVSLSEQISEKKFQDFFCGRIAEVPGLEVKIVDEKEAIVPVNTRGEIYVRSPGMFKCYYNDPDKTAAVLSPDGWYRTDDIGMMTKDAEIFVYGRKSHMIISGGMNVSPEILERAMKACPGVATVVIVPVPDDVYYQVLCACVIRKEGSDVTEEQLRRFCEEIHNDSPGLFTVLPKFYIFLENYPETFTGKIDRVGLIELASNMFAFSTKTL